MPITYPTDDHLRESQVVTTDEADSLRPSGLSGSAGDATDWSTTLESTDSTVYWDCFLFSVPGVSLDLCNGSGTRRKIQEPQGFDGGPDGRGNAVDSRPSLKKRRRSNGKKQ